MNDNSYQIYRGKPSGFEDLLGYRTPIWEEGHAIFEVEIDERHTNSGSFPNGGVSLMILDAGIGYTSTWYSVEGNFRRCVTLSLTSNFAAVARSKIARAEARLRARKNGVATCRGEVHHANDVICLSRNGSYLCLRGCDALEGITPTWQPQEIQGEHS